MAATMTPRLVGEMLAALHGAEGRWGPSAEPLEVALRLEDAQELEAAARTLEAWGVRVVGSDPRGSTLACRVPPGRLWDILGLEGLCEVYEAPAPAAGRARLLRWAPLAAAVLAAGLMVWWSAASGGLRRSSETPPRESAPAQRLGPAQGVVEAALAGDSLRLEAGQVVRLAGVRAPAPDEIYGPEARRTLAELVEGRPVALAYPPEPSAEGGGLLAFVSVADGTEVNAALLERGACQLDLATAGPRRRASYGRLEAEARGQGRGLWGGPVVGNLSSRVYHLPGGQFYQRVGPENRVLFADEDEARAAGYRPSSR